MGKIGSGGKHPTPTKLKLLSGGRSHHKKNTQEPKPRPFARKHPPRWMTREAKAYWRKMGPVLRKLGVLTEVDEAVFTMLCETYSEWKQCMDVLRIEGKTFTTPNGYIQQRPEMAIARKARKDIESLSSRFGLDPASRTRIHAVISDPDDDWEDLLD